MAQARGSGASDTNMEMWAFLIVVLVCLAFWLIDRNFWVYATMWRWTRIAEIAMFAYVVPQPVENFIGVDFGAGLQFLLETKPTLLTAAMISGFDNIYVKFFNWLPGLFLAFSGAKLFLASENVSFSKYNMESLLLKMSRAFPNNKMFLNVHPELTPLDFYPDDPSSYEYSMAMTERQFGQCVPPVGLDAEAKRDPSLRKAIWDGQQGFNDELCRKAFDKQVGNLYMGHNRLDENEKKLIELFRGKILLKRAEVLPILMDYVEKIVEHRKANSLIPSDNKALAALDIKTLPRASITYLEDFSSHVALVEMLTTIIDGMFKKQGPALKVKEAEVRAMVSSKDLKNTLRHVVADSRLSKHAFTYTGMMTLLEAAREGEALAPSSFRWLKGRNRTLWYALNCVGKKTAFTESAGTYGHWLLEKDIKMGVPHAETTEAIEALRVALDLPARPGANKQDEWA